MNVKQTNILFNNKTGSIATQLQSPAMVDESTLQHHIETGLVNIHPDFTYQTMEGFGCAMTESASYLLSRMKPDARREALSCWFGPDKVNARFIRMHLDSCDYSLEEYQAVADPIKDPELSTFTIERDLKYTIPMVKEAMELSGQEIGVLLSPWSPPYQWKTPPEEVENEAIVYGDTEDPAVAKDQRKPSRCHGGRLKPAYYSSWAKYIVKYIQAYLAEGIPVTMLSVQNEANAATPWDSCRWTSEQEMTFLKEHLYPAMKEAGLTDKIGIYIWDHNRERLLEHVDEMMKGGIADMVEGFAYHWYAGEHHNALSMLRERYPDKLLIRSEGCPLHIPGVPAGDEPKDPDTLQEPERSALIEKIAKVDFEDAMRYGSDVINGLNHGMNRWIEWNAIVDRNGGPRHVPGGFAAPLIYEKDGSFSRTVSYEYILAMARAVAPGAVRLGSTSYTRDLDAAAVKNPNGSIGLLLLNYTEEPKNIAVRFNGQICQTTLPGRGLSTLLFQ